MAPKRSRAEVYSKGLETALPRTVSTRCAVARHSAMVASQSASESAPSSARRICRASACVGPFEVERLAQPAAPLLHLPMRQALGEVVRSGQDDAEVRRQVQQLAEHFQAGVVQMLRLVDHQHDVLALFAEEEASLRSRPSMYPLPGIPADRQHSRRNDCGAWPTRA